MEKLCTWPLRPFQVISRKRRERKMKNPSEHQKCGEYVSEVETFNLCKLKLVSLVEKPLSSRVSCGKG